MPLGGFGHSLAKWYAAAKLALARNRPLTAATAPPRGRHYAAELATAELGALHSVGAFFIAPTSPKDVDVAAEGIA